MKRLNVAVIVLVSVLAVAFTSCQDKESERRIAELESQVAQMASGGGAATPTSTPAVQPAVKPEGPTPSFQWEAIEHDFGTISEGDVKEYNYKFTNTGDAPLIIESAKPSCGCTVPTFTKTPIGIGETGEILVKFDSKGKPNAQNKTVTVTANTWPKVTTLRFKTFVTPAGQASSVQGPVKK